MSLEIGRNGRNLTIDDQQSIHDAFRTILESLSMDNEALNSFEKALFGDVIETNNKDAEFGLNYAHHGEQGFEKVRAAVPATLSFGPR